MAEHVDHVDQQDDEYMRRRADLEARFQGLPHAGTSDYWLRMERPAPNQELPLEVVARCLRERGQAGAWADAERVYSVVFSARPLPGHTASPTRPGVKRANTLRTSSKSAISRSGRS
ncbi:MAG TPA: hypothetical protein VIC85_13315 [Ktedonobacterales bacterium]